MLNSIEQASEYILNRSKGFVPEVAMVLGTGLGNLVDSMEVEHEIAYAEIPGFPVSTVQSHSGKLLLGKLENRSVVVMQGRIHFYEGYSIQEVVFPIRVMLKMGAKALYLTNAAGGLSPAMEVGEVMLITDHINLLGVSPLMGPNDDRLGPRFPDMSKAYCPDLCKKARKLGQELGIRLHEGVYAIVSGPSLETPAEYKYLRIIGVDCVGMSTVPEVTAAVHMGVPCFALSAVTDLGVAGRIQETNLEDVLAGAEKAGKAMSDLLRAMLRK
jgi:purine-nucleoside phosphorylase